uniref:Tenascin-X isoform X2 n=1 Tax=Geotrypetes seraphini TaxID=260995 RepID=A0A6P8P8X3_GEOSA|nr:tenascin-X isoform X2 [Geotrypetes seraphini]
MLSHALTVFLTTLVLGAAGLTVFTKQFRSKRATGSNDTDPLMHRASGEHPFGHKLEGEKQMVFTHQINLPSQSCECPDRNLVRTLLSRLEALETQVMALKQTCPGGGGTRPGPGPADARALCAQHGKFDQAACKCQCDAGWKGPTCSEPSCPSDCHGRGTCVDGSCFCQDGFMGESCEETSCPDDCNDQGRCVQGRCVCFRGYTGPSCGDPSCPEDCGSHGRCVQDVCICEEGFSGPDCSTKACPENCRNQGQCFGGKCICDPGFTGPDCGTKTCPENCRNRGRCVNGKCVCDVGFAGPDCSTKSCPENCRNRGRCVNGKCVCISGYTGPDCGARACPENCRNRGQCVNGKCICNPGYTGVSCGNRMCPDNCSNRGRCVDGRCICDTGFSGPNCGTRTCPDNCMSQGQCVDGRCICDTGFTGPNCGTKTCPDNCMDQGQCYNGQCICDTGFTGTNCATRTCPGNCMDQGQCADGRCICDSGFTGPNCASRTCPDNCMDQGQCADGRCICDSGFTGLNCATRTCPDNCMSRGKCVDGECICDSGFTGPNCATRTCPDNCMDRGQCIDGRCICDSSFTGPNCATRTCPDNCMDRGQCVDGRCICDSGFTGPNCATRTCPDNCMDRGQCVDGRCICDSGFTGPNCATRTCPDNCMDQGQCVDGRCICDSGFAGPNCATRTCPDNCMDRGQCVDGRCICDSGLTGPNCVTRTCPDNCMSRGQCVDGQCICKPGYTGQNCGTRTCPNNCSNQGRCENGKCVCDEGYYGPICGNKACSNNCNNRGRCLKGACVCRRGYTGPDCGEAVCPNECSQRGTCQDGKCLCAEGYGGEDCSEEVPAVDGLVVKSREETSATVEWNRPRAPVDGYEISFTPTKEDNGIPPAQLSSTATSFHQTGLAPGQEYKVTIRAQKSQTLGPETTKTFTTPIDAPKALHPTDVTPSSIRLQWERPVASVDRYLITYIPEGGRQKRVQVPAAEDHVQLKDLDSATEYDITVVSQRAREQSKPVSIKVTTVQGSPSTHPIPEITSEHSWVVEEPQPTSKAPEAPTRVTVGQPVPPGQGPLERKPSITTEEKVAVSTDIREGSPNAVDSGGAPSPDGVRREGPQKVVTPGKMPSPMGKERVDITTISRENSQEVTPGKETLSITDERIATTTIKKDGSRVVPPRKKPATDKEKQLVTTNVTAEGSTEKSPAKRPQVIKTDVVTTVITRWESKTDGSQEDRDPTTEDERVVTVINKRPTHTTEKSGDTTTSTRKEPQRPVVPSTSRKEGGPEGEPPETRPSPTKTDILDRDQRKLEKEDPIKMEIPTAKDEKAPGNHTASIGSSAKVLVKPTRIEGHLFKNMIYNISAKLSPFNGTLLQRLESYLKASSYPLRDNQTIKSVAKSIFLYLLQKKPPHITQEVYNRLLELTSEDHRTVQLRTSKISQEHKNTFPGPTEGYRNSEKMIFQEETSKNLQPDIYGHQGGLSSIENIAGPYIEGKHSASEESQERDYRPVSFHATSRPDLKKHSSPEVVDKTPTSIVISLDGLRGHSSNVVVNYKDISSAGPGHQLVFPGDAKTAEIPGLAPGTTYRVDLHGILRGQSSKSYSLLDSTAPGSSHDLTPSRQPPLPPSKLPAGTEAPDVTPESLGELSAANTTSGGLSISWTATPAAFQYFVIRYRDSAAPAPEEIRIPGDERSTELAYLIPSTEYEIQLIGVAEGQPSSPLITRVITAPPGPRDHLNHLGNLTVENKKATSFRLAWKARKGAYDSFLVRYEDTADQLGPQETSVLGDLRSTVVKGLRPDTEYAVSLYGVRNGFLSRPLKTAVTTASLGNDGIQPRIEDLSASDIKGDSVRLSWTVLDGDFDYFLLQYKDPQGQMREQTIRGDLTSTLVSGLRPSQNYTFILCGISDDKRSEPLSIEVTTGSPDYLLPQLGTLSVSDVTENSLQLSWTVLVGDFDSFLLQYRDSEGKTRPQQLSGNLRTATISNLRPAWTYKFNLYGMAAEKHSKPISVEATTAPAVPSALGDLSISDVSQDSLQLSWTVQGKGFDSFLVMYRDSEGRTQRRSVTGDKRTATISGLAPETKYKFHLYGVSGKTHSKPKSAEATTAVASSTKVPPQQPSLGDLSFSDVTEDALRLTWTVPNGGFDSFLIQYRDTEGKPHTIPVSGDLRSTVISGLKPSRKYKFILYGVFDNKRSKPVAVEANTALVEKARLGDLSISNITVDSLQLSWTVPDGNFDSFLIMYRNALGEPQEVTLDGSLRDTTISGLKPAKKYKFILYGVSDDKRSKPASAEAITGKTILIQKAAVGDLSASNVTKDSLQLSWTVQEGKFDSFLIQYKDAEGKPLEVQVDGDHQTTTVLDLKPGKKYKFTLYGVLNNKRTKPLITEATTVSPQIAATLGDLSISNITEDAVQLSWTVQDGEFDSFLIQYTDEEGKTREVPIDEELRSTIISGLEPSKKYNFNLYGVLNHVRSTPVSAEAITAPSKTVTQKATLEDLSISSVTEDSLQLTWTVSDGEFDSFLIQYTDEEGKTREVPIDGELHTTIISGLEPSMKYNFNIYGILNNKPSTPVSAEATTASPKKATLEDLSISNVNKDSLQLSWTVKDGEFDSFLIQYTDEEGKTLEVPVDGELHTTTIPGLEPSMTYKFNIYGILNNEYTAPVSAEATTAAKEETVKKVPVPGDLSVFNITEDSLWLSWTTKDGQFDSFLIQYKDAEGKLQEVPIDGDLHTTLISGLKPFKKYKFNLYGVLENKHSEPVSTEATTVKKTIQKAKLEDLSISDITEDSLRLSWTVQDGNFDSFLILYKNTDGELQEVPIDGKHQTTIITGLKPSKKYKFVLYGVSDNKRSKPVSAEAITVIPKATLGDLSISNITEDSLQLSWTVQDGKFDSFLIQYKDVEGKLQEVPVDGDFDKTTISGLKPSKKYKFSLYGVLNSKRSKPVSAEAITAEKPSGQQPQLRDLSVSDVTEHSIRLSWTVQGGDFDSFLLLYRDQEGRAQKVPVAGNERSVTITGLVPDRRVKFYLHGISGNTRSKPVSVEALTASPTKATPGPPQLQDLTASDITDSSLKLSWTTQDGEFDSFIIQYKNADGELQEVPIDRSQNTATIGGLKSAKKYKFHLYGIVGDRRTQPIFVDATTALTVPSLKDLAVSDITEDTLRLSWTIRDGEFDSFVIQYRDAEGKPQEVPVHRDDNTAIISGLKPAKNYKFTLYGIYDNKRSKPISTEATTDPLKKPLIPPRLRDLEVSDITKNSLQLSWKVQDGVFDSFVVQYKDSENRIHEVPVNGNERSTTILGLLPSHKYKFNLYGITGDTASKPESIEANTAHIAFPEVIGQPATMLDDLYISDVGSNALQLSWEAPKEAFDSFLVQYGVSTAAVPKRETVVAGDLRKILIGGLHPNTKYNFTLSGIQAGQMRANLSTTGQTSRLELEAPRDLQFSNITETSTTVSWTPPMASVERYKVSFQLAQGGEPQSVNVDSGTTKTTLTGLIPGSRYEVSVMALRGFEESEPLTGFLTTVPDGPTNLRAVNVDDSSALLVWKPPLAAVDSYIIAYEAENAPAVTRTVSGSSSSLPLSGLSVDTEYKVEIHSVRGSNSSSPSSTTFTTGADAPRDLTASEVTPRSALLSWTAPQVKSTGYILTYETPSREKKEVKLAPSVTSLELWDLIPANLYQARLQALRGVVRTAPTSTSFTTGRLRYPFPRDCVEEYLNGITRSRPATIYLGGDQNQPMKVFCDMETDGGGWIVFQRRMNGKTDFWRDWEEYAVGFGNLSQEFWLGNNNLNRLTSQAVFELRVDLHSGNDSVYALYDYFRLEPESKYFRLRLGKYSGTAGDSLSYHIGSVFSTRDRDYNRQILPCAVSYRGAWWYRNCHYSNLNGMYSHSKDHQGITWYSWKGFDFSIPFTEMKLRPRNATALRKL